MFKKGMLFMLSFFIIGFGYVSADLTDWLVWSWDLNGNATDTSGNGNNWTVTNVSWVDSGNWDWSKVANFNWIDSYISIPSSNIVDRTFSARVKLDKEPLEWEIKSIYADATANNWIAFLQYDRYLWKTRLIYTNYKWNKDTYTDVSLWTTDWHHIAWVRSWWNTYLYLDWKLLSSWTLWWNWNYWTYSTIWAYRDSNNARVLRFFDWQIQGAKLYNRSLSTQEIQQLYQEWNNHNISYWLVWKWDLNGNATDTSGNGNNWSTYNVTWEDSGMWDWSKVANFNWENSYIEVPYTPDLAWNDNMYISMNVYPIGTWYQMLFTKFRDSTSNSYFIMYDWITKKFVFWIRDSTETAPANWLMKTINTFPQNNLYHVVARVTNKKVELYIDWVLQPIFNYSNSSYWDTVINPINWTDNQNSIQIWRNNFSWFDYNFIWKMSQIKFYAKPISDTEIKQLYQGINQPLSQELINETNQELSNPVPPIIIPQTEIISKENIYLILFGLIITILLWITWGKKNK